MWQDSLMSNPFTTFVAFLAQHSGCIHKHQNSGGKTTTTGFVPPRLHFTTQTTDKQPNTNDRVNGYITDLSAIKHFPFQI